MRTDNPYRPERLAATFEDWIVRKNNALLTELSGTFTVEIRLLPVGKGRRVKYRYHAHVGTAANTFPETFAESKFEGCKAYVESQFKRKVKDWEEIA